MSANGLGVQAGLAKDGSGGKGVFDVVPAGQGNFGGAEGLSFMYYVEPVQSFFQTEVLCGKVAVFFKPEG
jgi:hypothetical protein